MVRPQLKQFQSIITFALKNDNNGLLSIELIKKIFNNHKVNLVQIGEILTSVKKEFNLKCISDSEQLKNIENELDVHCENIQIRPEFFLETNGNIPWFPQNIMELYKYCNNVTGCSEVETGHPGFTDDTYRERRKYIVGKTLSHKPGQLLPHIDYTPEETEAWSKIFTKLTKLHSAYACQEYNKNMAIFKEECGYSADEIPQMDRVSKFLQERTGSTLYPVAGFLSPRDFLASLAYRVFRCTQYLRHSSEPLFTPEPDVCHELIGHAPMFADADFAEFSQEIGLASLGASDEYIEKLGACFWWSIEFGLCRQNGDLKAYGAGLLSSYGELESCFSKKQKLKPFIIKDAVNQKYKLTEYQPMYFVAESFSDATQKIRQYAQTILRPFNLKYNKDTQSVEIF